VATILALALLVRHVSVAPPRRRPRAAQDDGMPDDFLGKLIFYNRITLYGTVFLVASASVICAVNFVQTRVAIAREKVENKALDERLKTAGELMVSGPPGSAREFLGDFLPAPSSSVAVVGQAEKK
jgi:hypothetical protein